MLGVLCILLHIIQGGGGGDGGDGGSGIFSKGIQSPSKGFRDDIHRTHHMGIEVRGPPYRDIYIYIH